MLPSKRRCALQLRASLALCLGAALVAAAALTFSVPAAAQLGTGRQVAPPSSPIERAVPEPQPQALPPLVPTPAPTAPEAPSGPPVTIQNVQIEGTTVYSTAQLAPFYADMVGKPVPLSRVSGVLQQIQTKYRNDGYFLTIVRGNVEPAGGGQSILRIRVIEGFISDVKIDGDIGPVGVLVYNFLNKLTSVRPVNISDVERALLLAQDVPGVSVRAVLRPGTGEAGAVELVGQVGRKPFDALVQYDNRASNFAGPHELLLGAYANSFTSAGERTEILLYDTPFNTEQVFGQGSIEGFVGSSGLKLRAYAGYGFGEPGGALGVVGFRSRLLVAGTAASYPIIRTRPLSLTAILSFDVTQADIDSFAAGTSDRTRTSTSDVRAVRLGETLDFQDETAGTGLIGANTFTATVSQGLNILGASNNEQPTARVGVKNDFTKLAAEFVRVQNLVSFGANLLALKLDVGGQYTQDILPPSEEFFLGGTKFGRGFFSGEVIGDQALGTSTELQLNSPIETPVHLGLQYYIFYDRGMTWSLAPGDISRRLESAGLGVRVTVMPQILIELEGVHRFTRHPAGEGAGREGAEAGFVTVIARF